MLESCVRPNSVVIACHLCSLGHYHTGIVHTETCSMFKSNMLEGVFFKCMARVTTTNFMVVETTEKLQSLAAKSTDIPTDFEVLCLFSSVHTDILCLFF